MVISFILYIFHGALDAINQGHPRHGNKPPIGVTIQNLEDIFLYLLFKGQGPLQREGHPTKHMHVHLTNLWLMEKLHKLEKINISFWLMEKGQQDYKKN